MVAFFGKRKGYFFLSASKRTFLWQLELHSKWEKDAGKASPAHPQGYKSVS
jgi:hypothetical protein